MLVSAINSINHIGYNGLNNKKSNLIKNDSISFSNKSASTIKEKQWWHPIASLFIPGLGQFFQNRTEEGIKHLLTYAVLGFATRFVLNRILDTNVIKEKKAPKVAQAVVLTGIISVIGIKVVSAIDAYKGGKK